MHQKGLMKWLLVVFLVVFLMDWYVFNGLKTLTAGWKSKRRQRVVRWGYLVVSIGVTVVFALGLGSFNSAKGMTPFHEWMLSLFLTLLITRLVFVLVLFLGDLGRLFYGVGARLVQGPKKDEPFFPARRRFISEVATLVAAVPFTGFMYAMLKGKYDYTVHKTTIYFDDLPAAFDGFTITQLSDIHSGSFDDTAAMKKGIELARAQNSDLFVFTGDLVNNAAWEIVHYIPHFGQLKAPYDKFSILGNHDYGEYIKRDSEAEQAANLQQLKMHHT